MKKPAGSPLPDTLKSLVRQSVALFGEVVEHEVGRPFFQRIENLREEMSTLRGVRVDDTYKQLEKHFRRLKSLSPQQRLRMARSFTLMLELMNACENAYRTSRSTNKTSHASTLLKTKSAMPISEQITYVLTAHPTEARAPDNIAIFHQIQCLLILVLQENGDSSEVVWSSQKSQDLKHLLEIAWQTPIVRHRAPKVKDEAEHIYSTLFRTEVFGELLEILSENVPLRLHTWVGGDKDGHPGVQEQTLLESLTLSRSHLIELSLLQLQALRKTLALIRKDALLKVLATLEKDLRGLRKLQAKDGGRVQKWTLGLHSFSAIYVKEIGEKHPGLRRLEQVIRIFPGLVAPLELRESSDVLMTFSNRPQAIDRMLKRIESLSQGGHPRWYAHGFIISMAQSMEHIREAAERQKKIFGNLPLPIIPLFEDVGSLAKSPQILKEFVKDRALMTAAKKNWNKHLEVMVGYSDSSKEAGVLFSRLAIAEALPVLEKICTAAGLVPVFFHGSGGSVDRGGGSIQDQTAWWPRSALKNYKVTIQGEMVERTLATAEIARSQVEHIVRSVEAGQKRKTASSKNPILKEFATSVQSLYAKQIRSPEFLHIVEKATPYSFLRLLKMGSRPAKRAQQLEVSGLRAIPWILCWTQTRVLFPTWWGVGSAWQNCTSSQKKALQKAFKESPVFTSYVKALGFTLAKTELGIWRLYLEQSKLEKEAANKAFTEFEQEWKKTCRFFQAITAEKSFTWEKPWLGQSIWLRSPMIHPLNLLQILAQQDKDVELLRVTATGISSGMLTTG